MKMAFSGVNRTRNLDGTMACEHGMTGTRVYDAWLGMKQRCLNKNNPAYPRYGGRGIAISESWLEFENFLADMGEPPQGLSLDRIDNNGPYSRNNCRWADRKTQSRNRRNVTGITVDGVTLSAVEWAERTGICGATIRARLRKGWSEADAVLLPLIRERKGIPRGTSIHAWGAEQGIRWSDRGLQ